MDDERDGGVNLQHSRELLPTIGRLLRWRGLQEWLSSSSEFAAGYFSRQLCVAFIPGEVVQEGTYAGAVLILREVHRSRPEGGRTSPFITLRPRRIQSSTCMSPVHLCHRQKKGGGLRTASRPQGSFSPILAH